MMSLRDIPTLNALLNGLSALLLVIGYFLIRAKKRETHQKVMTAALCTSALFLVSYLVYHSQVGSVKFQGTGTVRAVYLGILLTHTILATAVAPAAIALFVLARKKRFDLHRKIARVTLPVWIYVSITGVVVYAMLYRMRW